MFDDTPNDNLQVGPTQPLPLRFRLGSADKVPEGAVLMETLLEGRMIARSVVDAKGGEALSGRGEVTAPLLLQAEERDGEIRGRILALFPVPEDQARDMLRSAGEDPDEPWKESVPSFEDESKPEIPEGAVPMAAVLLGNVRRFAADRQHPDDAQAEAASLFQAILAGAGKDADQKAIDDLLDSI